MNRTDRLYAIVEELRSVAPRPRSARWLAERFEVSTRTVERDVSALQLAGTPIWADLGRSGGYCIDRDRTLPPMNFTPQEAVALAVALDGLGDSPFRPAARVALRKVVSAMRTGDVAVARGLADRVRILGDEGDAQTDAQTMPSLISHALSSGRVLRIRYTGRDGESTERDIEPVGYIKNTDRWYLVAWCRLREATRAFRVDRVESMTQTAEALVPRSLRAEDLDIPYGELKQLDPL